MRFLPTIIVLVLIAVVYAGDPGSQSADWEAQKQGTEHESVLGVKQKKLEILPLKKKTAPSAQRSVVVARKNEESNKLRATQKNNSANKARSNASKKAEKVKKQKEAKEKRAKKIKTVKEARKQKRHEKAEKAKKAREKRQQDRREAIERRKKYEKLFADALQQIPAAYKGKTSTLKQLPMTVTDKYLWLGPHRNNQPAVRYFIGKKNRRKSITCQIDCMSEAVQDAESGEVGPLFDECKYRYYTYGATETAGCVQGGKAGTKLAVLALNVCVAYSQCKLPKEPLTPQDLQMWASTFSASGNTEYTPIQDNEN
jgi:hypothetical protein